jgi:hypothetical protein
MEGDIELEGLEFRRKKRGRWKAGTKVKPYGLRKPRSDNGNLAFRQLPACLLRPNSWNREAVRILKLAGRRGRSFLRLFLASWCGVVRLVGDARPMTLGTGLLWAGVLLVSRFFILVGLKVLVAENRLDFPLNFHFDVTTHLPISRIRIQGT